MKKRLMALLLMLVVCITFIPTNSFVAKAAETETVTVNQWAIPDIMAGESYGIYPGSWSTTDMTKAITKSQFRTLLTGVKSKILESECAKEVREERPVLKKSITVEEALNSFYLVLSNYDYTKDLGIDGKGKPVDFMKKHGIYTGKNGEQKLSSKCSIEQAVVIASRLISYVYSELDCGSKGFLWEVKAGENTVYMLGSIHLAETSIYPFGNKIKQAYEKSDALVVEANVLDQQDLTMMEKYGFYTDGTTLKDYVSAETYQLTMETAALAGLPESFISLAKPWFLFLLFQSLAATGTSQDNQLSSALGIDMTFLKQAYLDQKPIYAIEGLEKQCQILDSFSDELEEYLLKANAEALKAMMNGTADQNAADTNDVVNLMLDYWEEGDMESFLALNQDDDIPEEALSPEIQAYADEYQKKFFDDRDQNMADYIDQLLKSEGSNTYFVIVGSAHYLSENSVLKRLEKKGYQIDIVK